MVLRKESFETKNKRLFERWSLAYDGFWFRLYFEPLSRHIMQVIEDRKKDALISGGSMLDIACGTGELLKRFAEKFPEAIFVGIDLTEGMIAKAKEKTWNLSNVSVLIGNAEKLSFCDSSFDVVLISDALHHMFAPETAVHEVRRVLKKDGLFLLVDPAKETPIMIIFGWLFKPLEKAYRYYSQAMLEELFIGGGLTVLEKTRLFLNNFMFA